MALSLITPGTLGYFAAAPYLRRSSTFSSDADRDFPGPPGPFDIRRLAGITAPLGFWDPLGLSDGVEEGRALFYREVEIKHGRVAMLASVGFVAAESFRARGRFEPKVCSPFQPFSC